MYETINSYSVNCFSLFSIFNCNKNKSVEKLQTGNKLFDEQHLSPSFEKRRQ